MQTDPKAGNVQTLKHGPLSPSRNGVVFGAAATLAFGALLVKKKFAGKRAPAPKPLQTTRAAEANPAGMQQFTALLSAMLPLLTALKTPARPHAAETVQPAEVRPAETHPVGASASDAPSPRQYVEQAAQTASQVARIAPGSWWRQGWQMAKAAVNAWIDDFAPSMGAAIAYYTIFSIAPMLVIAIAVAGMIFGQDAAQGEIVAQLRGLVGTDGALAVQGLLKSASTPSGGAVATVLSVITLAIGATAVFVELQSALDRIWRVPAAAKESGIWSLIRSRLLSFGFVLGLGFLLVVSLIVSAALSALGKWWAGWFGSWQLVLQALDFLISILVFTCLFSVIYKFMPRVRLSWHDVWIGAISTTLLFTAGKYLIGLYLGRAGMSSGFGATGSIALLLAWVYYSAQIFLLGAEFTWIYANNYGSRAVRAAPGMPG